MDSLGQYDSRLYSPACEEGRADGFDLHVADGDIAEDVRPGVRSWEGGLDIQPGKGVRGDDDVV